MSRELDVGMPRGFRVDGVVMWHGVIVRCANCGNAEGLMLYVIGAPYSFGERAWAECNRKRMCGSIYHPLIYPEFVRTVGAWLKLPPHEQGSLGKALDEIGWQPHRLQYVPWVADGTAPDDDWRLDYPELVTAAEQRDDPGDSRPDSAAGV